MVKSLIPPHHRKCHCLWRERSGVTSGSGELGIEDFHDSKPASFPASSLETGQNPVALHRALTSPGRTPCPAGPLPHHIGFLSSDHPQPICSVAWGKRKRQSGRGSGRFGYGVTGQVPLFLGITRGNILHILALSTDAGMAVATAAEAPTAVEDGGKLKGCERNQKRTR